MGRKPIGECRTFRLQIDSLGRRRDQFTNVAEVRMSGLTVFLARSLGLFMILLVAGFWLRGGAGIEASVSDGALLLGYAIISLAMGIAMVVGHNVWSAGAL